MRDGQSGDRVDHYDEEDDICSIITDVECVGTYYNKGCPILRIQKMILATKSIIMLE